MALLIARPGEAQVTEQNFLGGRTSDLAILCGASPQNPTGHLAVIYCQGFMVGAGQYHASLTATAGAQRPHFCLPEPSPTFDQARAAFVEWARAHPQHAADRAIDGLIHFAVDTYPCPPAPAARPRR